MKIKRWWEFLKIPLYLVAPPLCILCKNPVNPEEIICQECKKELEKYLITPPRCLICGEPMKHRLCLRCREEKFTFKKVRGVYIYEGPVIELIELFKYQGLEKIAEFLGEKMVKLLNELGEVDYVVPVPLHPARKRERGFSQTALLAKVISQISGIPFLEALIRRRYTKSQTRLGKKERKENLKNAFFPVDDRIKERSILLVDDVLTTGVTLNEASSSLLKGGAIRVSGIVGAIARLYLPD